MISLVLPLLVTITIAAIATSAHHRLPPRLATRFVTVTVVVVVLAALPTISILALAFLAHVPIVGVGLEWCARAIGLHSSVPAWLGLPAVGMLVVGVTRAALVVRDHRALRSHHPHPIHVADSDKPYAVTLPGRAGQIVISTALMDLLADDERDVVIAHERAHARYRHDRYLVLAELGAALLPPLRVLTRRVNYSIERWADEAAAAACGDRHLVATTLGRVALHTQARMVPGFAGLGVAARMGALLEPPVPIPHRSHVVALWSSLAVALGFGVYQLHHLERLVMALCPH